MDRDDLAALDKDALIELIVRLYERLTELETGAQRPPKTRCGLVSSSLRPGERLAYAPRRRSGESAESSCRPTSDNWNVWNPDFATGSEDWVDRWFY